ncbi:MAG TPA: CBS domain-containing protein [Alphaproteobacteria bacterium]|jgi:CBS domain-containing protein|nr:CBS domain-containing protein [Alphaproteobacteria bacterium]
MLARDLMTRDVISVTPETPARDVARLLLDHAISAVPVIDSTGAPVGMISEGDLIARDESNRDCRRDWWLALLAEGQELSPDFLKSMHTVEEARHLMAVPVVTVDETTDASEIARLLGQYRIKRVPVVRDGHVVGIVSRADLLRAIVAEVPPAKPAKSGGGFVTDLIHEIEQRAHGGDDRESTSPQSREVPKQADEAVDASAFREATAEAKLAQSRRRDDERKAAAERRHAKFEELIESHLGDRGWSDLLRDAKQAAERGETEFTLLRFPSELLSDGGRAVNVREPDWPTTLRGEAAEMYLRWEHQLKPHGFRLSAEILDFPDGKPGDVALVLAWGE